MAIELGDRVEDPISGLKGIAVGRTDWMFGCVRISVAPEMAKDGKAGEYQSFDEEQLKVLKRGVLKRKAEVAPEPAAPLRRGGPRPDAGRAPSVGR